MGLDQWCHCRTCCCREVVTLLIRLNQIKLPVDHPQDALQKKIAKELHISVEQIRHMEIGKRSLDARKKPELFYLYQVDVTLNREEKLLKKLPKDATIPNDRVYQIPGCRERLFSHRPVVVGAGPAGLFCAYMLCLCGNPPIVIERGKEVDRRIQDIDHFWQGKPLDPNSNVQFGEGGAGTFSDGKLNTLIKDKSGKNRFVLETLVTFGAPRQILYDAKPHIGTDILCKVIRSMREYMVEQGVTFLFETQLTDFAVENGRIRSIVTNEGESIATDAVCLAIGHSARDTFEKLYEKKIAMEAKSFAVGFRVEHPRTFIDLSQYGEKYAGVLPAASYKLTAQTPDGRGVYTFCMCPGGYVVNASSEPGRLAVNGMSYSGRNGVNSNTAVIITVTPEDFPDKHPLAGLAFQRKIEENAYRVGNGKVPVERFGDFENAVLGYSPEENGNGMAQGDVHFPGLEPQIKGMWTYGKVHDILPDALNRGLIEGIHAFGEKINGYDSPDCVLSGVESRTSSPVRIARDEAGCSLSCKGLFPCGEGAGYAGGIMSAAMDGINIAEKMIQYAKGAKENGSESNGLSGKL